MDQSKAEDRLRQHLPCLSERQPSASQNSRTSSARSVAQHDSDLRVPYRYICATLSILTISIIPQYTEAFNDLDCGINRFNNESPLTERIVGGNNSLQ